EYKMIIPDLIDVIDDQLISKWREEIEKADECGYLKRQNELKEELKEQLDDSQMKNLNYLELAVENKMDYIYFVIIKQLFMFALKAGMDIQKALDEQP
ncbi:MAG: hypothetical protein K2K04_03075, partial [Clostridia bacterium]|nr:hypothetical protein [Clostridia bacterium]